MTKYRMKQYYANIDNAEVNGISKTELLQANKCNTTSLQSLRKI